MDVLLKYENELGITYQVRSISHEKGSVFHSNVTKDDDPKNRDEWKDLSLEDKIAESDVFRFLLTVDKMSYEEMKMLRLILGKASRENKTSLTSHRRIRDTTTKIKDEYKDTLENVKVEFEDKKEKYKSAVDAFYTTLKDNDIANSSDHVMFMSRCKRLDCLLDYDLPRLDMHIPMEWYEKNDILPYFELFFAKDTKMYQWFKDNGWLVKYAPSEL